jgi:hypothetical protein
MRLDFGKKFVWMPATICVELPVQILKGKSGINTQN